MRRHQQHGQRSLLHNSPFDVADALDILATHSATIAHNRGHN
jgi:hypothetical protein